MDGLTERLLAMARGASHEQQDYLEVIERVLDQRQVETLGLFLNNWLQQGALLGNLGQASKSGSSSSGVGVSGYASGSMSGGS